MHQEVGPFFWMFHKPFKGYIAFFFLCAAFLGLHSLINSYLIKVVIDSLTELPSSSSLGREIIVPAICIVVNFEIYNLCWRSINYINLKVTPIVKGRVIQFAFDYVHQQSDRYFRNTLSGAIANNISVLSESMERVGKQISVRIIKELVQLLAALIAVYFVHPVFSASLLIWALGFTCASLVFSKRIKDLSDAYAGSLSAISGNVVDNAINFSSVRVFSNEKYESSFLQRLISVMRGRFQRREWFLIRFYFIQGFSITCLIGFVIYWLVSLRASGRVSIGEFTFILGVTLYATENVWSFTEQIDQLNDTIGKARQSLKAIFTPIEIKDRPCASSLVIAGGEISFNKVVFHYENSVPLFLNHSVVIPPKQKVGLVGYSGSGKSSFVNLLLRLYDVISGEILVDGQDIRNASQQSLREAIGVIPQDPSLFHRTLIENIRYGRLSATDEEVMEAAKRAGIHEFISHLPQGYSSLVGERGMKLSGGQRQRIAIARIILKNAPILILDEATSQLDSITENSILDFLKEFMVDKTTIVIAHRLSTLLNMDRLLVFKEGKIVEDGTHEELLDRDGAYRALWEAQIGEFASLSSVQI